MRVVFDTNVLVSASLFGGLPFDCLRLASRRQITLVLSPAILDEFRRVLREKFLYADHEIAAREERIRRVVTLVEPAEHLAAVKNDPSDNRVLEAALAGKVDCIVSGDRHLLALGAFRDIPIVMPRQFIERTRRSERGD